MLAVVCNSFTQWVYTLPSENGLPWRIHIELLELEQRGLLRHPRIVDSASGRTTIIDGREVSVFSSNNYLDLANDPDVLAAVAQGLSQWGWGSGASRLLCGTTTSHRTLEEELASFKGYQAAVLFPTGYMANIGVLSTLAQTGDVILLDKLCHASIIDAARLSRATTRVFRHNDVKRLAQLLQRYATARRIYIVTEGIFSMDGDLADLVEIVALKNKYQAVLIVDDAHGTGVLGEHGRGTAELLGVEEHVDITVGTVSKAMGSMGGFVCCSAELARYLKNRSRSYIYTTAPPAVSCLAAQAALKIIEDQPQRRENIQTLGKELRDALRNAGFDLGSAEAHIIPVILGSNELALRFSEALWQQGFIVPAIREPTVARGTARLRISLTSSHNRRDIDQLVAVLVELGRELGYLNISPQA